MPNTNDLIVYVASQGIKCGQVVRDQRNRIQIRDANGRIESIKIDRVITIAAKSAAKDATELDERVATLAESIDMELLWSTLADTVTPKQAADEYFGSNNAVEIAAAAKALIDDSLHFKRRGLEFEPRSHREVVEVAEFERKKAEDARIQALAESFFSQLLKNQLSDKTIPADLEPMVDRIEAFLVRNDNTDAEPLMRTLRKGAPPRETALQILDKLGLLDKNVDPQLLLNGISPHFSRRCLEEAKAITGYEPGMDDKRESIDAPVFSIDDISTVEIDDAFSVQYNDDGTITVGIHIADPGWFVKPGDFIDREAAERTLSLYLPTCTVMMMPPVVGADLASLKPNQTRPALSLFVKINNDADVLDYRLALTELKDSRRLTYHEADAIIDGSQTTDTLAKDLRTLDALAAKLQAGRMANGAVRIIRPDIDVKVEENGDVITVEKCDNESPAHTLVGEFMVLLNHLIAKFALDNEIPLIYRCQPPPASKLTPMQEYSPVLFDRSVKAMRPTFFSTHPQSHAGLGLDVYTQFSSPLRRYHDLVMQRQTVAFMHDTPLPYTQEELVEILGNAEQVEKRNRKVEREVKKHWLLEYIRRNHLKDTMSATVVDRAGNTQLAELDEYLVRGLFRSSAGTAPPAGTKVNVKIMDVNPGKGTMLLQQL